jgi:Sporulation factor SpoIIGA.
MEIYIDIVYLVNLIVYLISLLSTLILLNVQLKLKIIIGVVVLLSFYSFSIYLAFNPILFYIILILIIMYVLFKKRFLYASIIFYVVHTTYIYSFHTIDYNCVIRNQVLMVPISFSWFYAFFLCSLIILIYTSYLFNLKEQLTLKQFIYPIKISYQNKEYSLSGFMDSGNQCIYQNEIVIFVLKDIFDDIKIKDYFIAKTISSNDSLPIFKCDFLVFKNQVFKGVYVALVDEMDIKNVNCLLNIKLIYGG